MEKKKEYSDIHVKGATRGYYGESLTCILVWIRYVNLKTRGKVLS